MIRHIYVAGVDYAFKAAYFNKVAENRVERIIAASKSSETLSFLIMDARSGVTTEIVVSYKDGKRERKVKTTQAYRSISKKNYTKTKADDGYKYSFKRNQRDALSILNIYDAVKKIGQDAPGTLRELSFFSHGWYGGPIIVNSYDLVNDSNTLAVPPVRDPDDHDPRTAIDFVAPTMDLNALSSFKKAFRPDGYVWIWGCLFPGDVNELIFRVLRHPAYKERGLDDSTTFRFKYLRSDVREMLDIFLQGISIPARGPISLTFGQLREVFCNVSQSTYAYHIAKSAAVPAFAAPPGTYSEQEPHGKRWYLMRVSGKFRRRQTFYKNYLGFTPDPEGYKYVKYEANLPCMKP